MEYRYYNPNPCGRTVGDCSVRAIAKALNLDWGQAFTILASFAYSMCDMPNADSVWGAVLRSNKFVRVNFPDGTTLDDIAMAHPHSICVVGFGGHVATIQNGILYDAWDSSNESPIYMWIKEE
jgi:hypothetical protein